MRRFRIIFLGAALAVATLGASSSGVAAYGAADHPVAQLEFSGNCNNPTFALCAPPPNGFGLGGIWLWIEIDANNTGDVAGAGCGHVRGGPRGGAGSIRGDVTWWWSQLPQGGPTTFGPLDPAGYYNVAISGVGVLAFPVTQGHYSAHPAPGVALETTVAP
jgi:hypothetical protein